MFKRSLLEDPEATTPRWVVFSVDFRLRTAGTTAPVRHSQLSERWAWPGVRLRPEPVLVGCTL